MSQYVPSVLPVLRACVCVCGLGIDKLHPGRQCSIWQTPGVKWGAVMPLNQLDHFCADRESKMYRVSRIRALTFQSSLLKRLEELLYIPAFQSSKSCCPSYFYTFLFWTVWLLPSLCAQCVPTARIWRISLLKVLNLTKCLSSKCFFFHRRKKTITLYFISTFFCFCRFM